MFFVLKHNVSAYRRHVMVLLCEPYTPMASPWRRAEGSRQGVSRIRVGPQLVQTLQRRGKSFTLTGFQPRLQSHPAGRRVIASLSYPLFHFVNSIRYYYILQPPVLVTVDI